jgi:hypothetical protein
MRRQNNALLVAALLLIGAAVAWRFGVARQWTPRLAPGWSDSAEYVGTMTYADPRTERLPDRDPVTRYERRQRVSPDSSRPDAMVLEDRMVIHDIATGKIIWEYTTWYLVDPWTGALQAKSYHGDIAVFPRGVQRTRYRLRANYVKGLALTFERVEGLDGLTTYVFAYRGRGEYTESYAGSGEYPGIKPPPGDEIRCADDQFYYRAWVEPLTGEQVKLEEGCLSGDYFYNTATGRRAGAVARWNGVTAGDALIERIAQVRSLRLNYLWLTRYVPAALLAFGIALLGLGLRRKAAPLVLLGTLVFPRLASAQDSAQTSHPWFVYLRDGGKSPLYAFASYSFGRPIVMAGVIVDSPNHYTEYLAGAGVNLFAANGNGMSLLALGSKASDSWYLEVYALPSAARGRLSATGFAGLYVPLQAPGVGQYFLDPVTLLWRLHARIAVGGSYTVYKIAGLPARHGAGPTVQVTVPPGSVTLDALAPLANFTRELRLTLQVAW